MVRDSNEYEVVHTVNISMELADGTSKSISSTFKIIPAKSLSDAKKKLDEATPKGDATIMSENSFKSYKHIYVEDINGYIVKHTIYVNKNGIKYKESNANLSSNEITPDDLVDISRTAKGNTVNTKNNTNTKSNKKKSNTCRSKSSAKKTTKKSSSKSSSKKKTSKSSRPKRTTVDYID